MAAPRITSNLDHTALPLHAGERAFSVSRDGWFAGRSWEAEEVVVVEPGTPEEGDLVVMVGLRGLCRLGRILEGQLVGAAGEPCAAELWRVAGRVRRTLRSRPPFWISERAPGAVPSEREERQLSLFAA